MRHFTAPPQPLSTRGFARARAGTFAAKKKSGGADACEWDVVLQRKNETVFLDP
jgi:hypothetical protein